MNRCSHCTAPLFSNPEIELGEWVVRCFICNAKNIVSLEVIGWRE
jgi:hypothetical protein